MYFAECSKLLKDVPARTLLEDLKRHHNDQLGAIDPDWNKEIDALFATKGGDVKVTSERLFDTIYGRLRVQTQFPLLVALDQWNAAIHNVDNGTSACLSQLSGLLQIRFGFHCCAMSSSFDPLGKLADADHNFVHYRKEIKPYDNIEWRVMLQFAASKKFLPKDSSLHKKLHHETGKVPRLLMWCKMSYLNNKGGNILADMRRDASLCYKERISRIIAKLLGKPKAGRHEAALGLEIATLVLLNEKIFSLPDFWQNCGLFAEVASREGADKKEFKPICPVVRETFASMLASYGRLIDNQVLDVLLSDSQTKWRAFELAVALRFKRAVDVTVITSSLDGKPRENIRLRVNNCFWQDYEGQVPEEGIKPGTALICAPNHKVCDMILFTTDEYLVFFQLSLECYAKHLTKVDGLWNKKIEDKYVLQYYADKCVPADIKAKKLRTNVANFLRNDRDTLPKNVYFVYATSAVEKPQTTHVSYVNLVHKDNLKELFGDLWTQFKDHVLPNPSKAKSRSRAKRKAAVAEEEEEEEEEKEDENDDEKMGDVDDNAGKLV